MNYKINDIIKVSGIKTLNYSVGNKTYFPLGKDIYEGIITEKSENSYSFIVRQIKKDVFKNINFVIGDRLERKPKKIIKKII